MEFLPTIHVIIPVYKSEKYVAQTLDSVLAQPYPNIRIVCVDDGSPDHSIDILRAYETKYSNVHVIRQENSGVSAARNTGIDYVLREDDSGYLTFLDADDLWARDVITAEEVAAWHEDCISYTSVRCSEDMKYIIPVDIVHTDGVICGGAKNVWVANSNNHHLGAAFYSCKLLWDHHLRFIPGLKYAEDLIFKFSCYYLAEQIGLHSKVSYLYRMNPAGAMSRRTYGIDYLSPVIYGYLKTYDHLRQYENNIRGSSRFCKVLAGVHVMDMAQEHFQQFRSKQQWEVFLKDNPKLHEIVIDLQPDDLADAHKCMRDAYLNNFDKFVLDNRTRGIKVWIRRILKSNRLVETYYSKQIYTESNCYL